MFLLDKIAAALAANVAAFAHDATPKLPSGPVPIPRPPKLCSDGGAFVNNATSTSPLVSDCLRLIKYHESDRPWTYYITKDVRHMNLASYVSCMFGARSTVGNATFNLEDQYALVVRVTKGLKGDERIEGTVKVDCGGTEVEWSVYRTRNSEWL